MRIVPPPKTSSALDQRKAARSHIRVGSLFAAIGGFCRAFEQRGATVLWANEKDRFAAETFKLNFSHIPHFHKPVEELSVSGDRLGAVDILTAGFPCQPFSIAGDKLGFKDDRGLLFLHIVRLIAEFGKQKPKILLLENVKNLKSHDKGRTYKRIQTEIQKAGYWFTDANAQILNTSTYTRIPQNRERIFMVAMSRDHFPTNSFEFPEPIELGLMNDVTKYLDLKKKADAIYYFQPGSLYYPLFKEAIDEGGKDSVYQLRRNYVRRNMSGMCFTLMANMGEGGHNQPVIKDRWGIRKLTPRECARLQGFKDYWFKIPASLSKTQVYKQIGNSVTVPLVSRIAENIIQLIEQKSLSAKAKSA